MAKGTEVRILVGKLKGCRGEVVKVEGRHATVQTARGTTQLLISQLEPV